MSEATDSSTPSDCAILVQQILAGNHARFAQVVERYDRLVRHIVLRSIADRDSIEETVQQTFYLAFKNLAALTHPERLEAWLATIARRCAIEHHRRSAREPHARIVEPSGVSAATWIWEEVDALPSAHATVLVLRYREGLSYREIAMRLGVEVSTVRGRIYEARRALRARLGDAAP